MILLVIPLQNIQFLLVQHRVSSRLWIVYKTMWTMNKNSQSQVMILVINNSLVSAIQIAAEIDFTSSTNKGLLKKNGYKTQSKGLIF